MRHSYISQYSKENHYQRKTYPRWYKDHLGPVGTQEQLENLAHQDKMGIQELLVLPGWEVVERLESKVYMVL